MALSNFNSNSFDVVLNGEHFIELSGNSDNTADISGNGLNTVMSKFEQAISFILKHEGGVVKDPVDPGGITNEGISLRYLKSLVKQHIDLLPKFDLDRNTIINDYDIQHMTVQQAEVLYKEEWWDKYHYGNIETQSLANKLFDLAINMGASKAAKLLQKACCQIAGYNCLTIAGVLGKTSLNYINQLDVEQQKRLLTVFCDLAAQYYRSLASNHPVYQKFLAGWLRRVYDLG